jgi:hypothetical protein
MFLVIGCPSLSIVPHCEEVGPDRLSTRVMLPQGVIPGTPTGKPEYCTSMPRSREVFDRLEDFPPSEIDTVIPLSRIILQPIKSLRDLTRQLVQYSG